MIAGDRRSSGKGRSHPGEADLPIVGSCDHVDRSISGAKRSGGNRRAGKTSASIRQRSDAESVRRRIRQTGDIRGCRG